MPSNRAAPGLLEGDRTAGGSDRQWPRCGYFPPAAFTQIKRGHGVNRRLCIAKQNSRSAAILRFRFGPPLRFGFWSRIPCREVIATKAAMARPIRQRTASHDRP